MFDAIEDLRIGISYYCNLHCDHCYVPATLRDGYRANLEPDQLSPDEIVSFMDDLRGEFGLQTVSITGGEALLSVVWPRTRTVMQHALASGLNVRLMTSGSGQVKLGSIVELASSAPGKLWFQISLDGTQEEFVNSLRNHKFAFRWATRAIKECADQGVRVRVRFTAMDGNANDTVATYDLASQLGASSFMVKPVFADGEARNSGDMFLTADSYRDLQYELIDHSIGRDTLLELPQPVYVDLADVPMSANVKLWERCSCAFESVYLSPVGDIWPCNYSAGDPNSREQILGNIKDEDFDFAAMWRSPASWPAYRQPAEGTCCVSQSLGAATLDATGRPELVTTTTSYPCL